MFSSKIQRHTRDKMQKRWWLFHATDFQSLMYPCFTFCRILGIFPYKINASTFEVSRPCYILSTVVLCVCCVFNLMIIHDLVISKTVTYGNVIKDLGAICYLLLSGLMAIITYILSGPRMRLLQTILEISSRLPSESFQKLSRLIHIKDILYPILIIVQVYFFFFKVHMFELNYWNVLIITLDTYLGLLVFFMNMLYMNCVCVLKACFKSINDNLVHIQKLMINDIRSCVLSLLCHIQRNQFLLIKLKTLKKQHLMFSDTVQLLNIIFSLQLLVTIIMSLTETTFELYSYVVRWQNGVLISFDRHLLDAFIISIMHYIIKITLVIWACETGKNQAQEIGTTIHDVLNSTRDKQIKDELQLFSLQILHCKNTFWTKGLTVDATLLTGIVGSITTYMLILIQFLITSHSCDQKS